MIILSPGNGSYKKGERTPLISIPIEAKGDKESLEDFQWWAKSKDFHEWLEKNPREWTAESIIYHNENEELIRANKIGSILNDWYSFLNEAEDKDEKEASEELIKKGIKFGYAYNRLIKAEDLETTFTPSKTDEDTIALFMSLVAEENDEDGMIESMQAYRAKVMKTSSSAFNLIQIDYALPYSEEISDTENFSTLVKNILDKSLLFGGAIGASLLVFATGKLVTKVVIGRWILNRGVRKFVGLPYGKALRAAKAASKLKKAARIAKATKYIKTGFGTISGIVTLKSSRGGVAAAIKASRIKRIKPVGLLRAFMRGSGVSHIFPKFMGKTGIKVGAKAGSKAIPLVGEILMVVDAAYSIWSWNRSSQAPKYKEVKSFATGEFNPKEIEVGIPITICWSQPSGSWLNWVASDETRTTMELIKIGENDGRSIFIMTQANSEGLQKELSSNALVMLAFENKKTIERGFFDNDDLDHELIRIKSEEGLLGPFIYQGHTNWDRFKKEFDAAPDYLIGRDKDAPDEFIFNFEDSDSDIINLTGRILDTDTIKKLKQSDIIEIFGFGEGNDISESEDFGDGLNLTIKTKIKDFLNEAIDDNVNSTLTLLPEDQTNPVWVAIYQATESVYANPVIGDKKSIPDLGYYLVYGESLYVDDGDPVLVFSSSDIEFTNSKKGLHTHTEEEKEDEIEDDEDVKDSKGDKIKTGDEDGESESELETTPDDVKYKERKNSVVIRDRIKKDGINIMNEFLSKEDKTKLQITSWKNITKINVKKRGGVISKITFHNSRAAFSDRKREYSKIDGEAYEIAKKLIDSVKNDIKYV